MGLEILHSVSAGSEGPDGILYVIKLQFVRSVLSRGGTAWTRRCSAIRNAAANIEGVCRHRFRRSALFHNIWGLGCSLSDFTNKLKILRLVIINPASFFVHPYEGFCVFSRILLGGIASDVLHEPRFLEVNLVRPWDSKGLVCMYKYLLTLDIPCNGSNLM